MLPTERVMASRTATCWKAGIAGGATRLGGAGGRRCGVRCRQLVHQMRHQIRTKESVEAGGWIQARSRRFAVVVASVGSRAGPDAEYEEMEGDEPPMQMAEALPEEMGVASDAEYEEFQRELEEEELALELEDAARASGSDEERLDAEALQDVFKSRKDVPGHYEVRVNQTQID